MGLHIMRVLKKEGAYVLRILRCKLGLTVDIMEAIIFSIFGDQISRSIESLRSLKLNSFKRKKNPMIRETNMNKFVLEAKIC